ncbi:peroxiredoxin [bacterium]|nr:peroxiredoxin [bacterium]
MEKLQDFELLDSQSKSVKLSDFWSKGATLFVFYPGDNTAVCTAQLCDYRDNYNLFQALGVQIVGISKDEPSSHVAFSKEHDFPFPLLSDPEHKVIKAWKCTSKWQMGIPSRAVALVSEKGEMVWKHVETLAITRRHASQLIEELSPLIRRLSLATR